MDLKTVKVGILQTNCYILIQNQKAIIIDPGAKAERILSALGENMELVAILLTHAHFDHIGAINDLLAIHPCPIYLHEDDQALMRDPQLNYSFPKRFIVDQETRPYPSKLVLGDFVFEVIETPGHTDGSVCLIINNWMFSGDTLFMQSVGRTDLRTGNPTKMKQSLRKLKALDQDYLVYPGHDDPTSLKEEKLHNIYLK
jgi:glyoxylase-like metal-dependent hydrolase (beta-lactamase superfamily II)